MPRLRETFGFTCMLRSVVDSDWPDNLVLHVCSAQFWIPVASCSGIRALCWTLCGVPCGVLGLNASQHGPPAGRVYLFYFPLTKMNQPKHMTRGWGRGGAWGVCRRCGQRIGTGELGPESWESWDQELGS